MISIRKVLIFEDWSDMPTGSLNDEGHEINDILDELTQPQKEEFDVIYRGGSGGWVYENYPKQVGYV